MKVFVYYNLHKCKWSIKALEGPQKNKVISHADVVELANVVPKVSEAGRLRVLRDKQKNVHAGLTGTLKAYADIDVVDLLGSDAWTEVTYNPYLYNTFVFVDDKRPYLGSNRARMVNKKVFIKGTI